MPKEVPILKYFNRPLVSLIDGVCRVVYGNELLAPVVKASRSELSKPSSVGCMATDVTEGDIELSDGGLLKDATCLLGAREALILSILNNSPSSIFDN